MRMFNIFRRKVFKPEPKSLRIDGTKTTLTPTPDDAELAATALLETLTRPEVRGKKEDGRSKMADGRRMMDDGSPQTSNIKHQTSNIPQTSSITHHTSGAHDAEYYRELSDRIKLAHEQERRMAMRYVAYAEQELKKEDGRGKKEDVNTSSIIHHTSSIIHQPSDIAELERGLYKFQDCAEREGGDLLKRWQKCLAEITVKTLEEVTSEGEPMSNESRIRTPPTLEG